MLLEKRKNEEKFKSSSSIFCFVLFLFPLRIFSSRFGSLPNNCRPNMRGSIVCFPTFLSCTPPMSSCWEWVDRRMGIWKADNRFMGSGLQSSVCIVVWWATLFFFFLNLLLLFPLLLLRISGFDSPLLFIIFIFFSSSIWVIFFFYGFLAPLSSSSSSLRSIPAPASSLLFSLPCS